MAPKRRLGLVLAGGAARGAYEVGVVEHVMTDVAKAIGREIRFDIVCGTSVGALNACALAAFAHEGREAVRHLVHTWETLDIGELVRSDLRGLLGWGSKLFGGSTGSEVAIRERGILDAAGLEALVRRAIPFPKIGENLAAGHLEALTVSTTHVASGKTVVYVQRDGLTLPKWSMDPTIVPRAAVIDERHALASAAIPILFRAVRIDGEVHCDGGLRQNVPLSPARRLGADSVLVVNPRHVDDAGLEGSPETEEELPGPFFLLGKTLNALLLDRIDTDLARLQSINRILDAGRAAYGPDFAQTLNRALGYADGQGMKKLDALLLRSSVDIGAMAADFVHSPAFSRVRGVTGRLLRHVAGRGHAKNEDDLLSYLLFDGEFAGRLIEVGRADARARHDELCAFFDAYYRAS
ncbi:MAG: patatin-like phospholipase family protein [Polyangiaceae bacterium]